MWKLWNLKWQLWEMVTVKYHSVTDCCIFTPIRKCYGKICIKHTVKKIIKIIIGFTFYDSTYGAQLLQHFHECMLTTVCSDLLVCSHQPVIQAYVQPRAAVCSLKAWGSRRPPSLRFIPKEQELEISKSPSKGPVSGRPYWCCSDRWFMMQLLNWYFLNRGSRGAL